MNFRQFLKSIRKTTYYDELMEAKEKENLPVSSDEFLAIFLINDLLDKGHKIFMILPLFEKKYHELIKQVIKNKFRPDKLVIAWSHLVSAVEEVEVHNSYVEDADYFALYYPTRKIIV